MTDDVATPAPRQADLLFVPPIFWRPMDLGTLKPGGFRRALNGAGMLWLSAVWVGLIVAAWLPLQPPAPQFPPAYAMAALCVPLTLWQLFGLWRLCSLPTPDGGKRTLSPKDAVQSLLLGVIGPVAILGGIVVLVVLVARP